MTKESKKKPFNWEAGESLENEDYTPLGKVRDQGFSKLADGLYADPQLRKKDRAKTLNRRLVPDPNKGKTLIEESESGLSDKYTPSEASRLIKKDKLSIKGLGRFGKKDS